MGKNGGRKSRDTLPLKKKRGAGTNQYFWISKDVEPVQPKLFEI